MIHSFVEWLQKVWFNLELNDGGGGGDWSESVVALAIIWYTEYRR